MIALCMVCMVLVVVDSGTLMKTVNLYEEIKPFVSQSALDECFRPQIILRIISSCYGILLSIIILTITLVSNIMSEFNHWQNKIIVIAINIGTIVFGPCLLTIVIVGTSVNWESLTHVCDPYYGYRGPNVEINY